MFHLVVGPRLRGRWVSSRASRQLGVVLAGCVLAGALPVLQARAAAAAAPGAPWGWGRNVAGELGDGTQTARVAPVALAGGLTQVVGVAKSNHTTAAVTVSGSVYAWGYNDAGQAGNGTVCAPSPCGNLSPTLVAGLSGVTAVAVGTQHVLALRSDGTVWAWGDNSSGQLGDGTTVNRTAPVEVCAAGQVAPCSAFLTGVTALAAEGGNDSLALRSDGTVWAWGGNEVGELGDGTTVNRSTPVEVCAAGAVAPCASFLSGVSAIAAGGQHSLAVVAGQVDGWGNDADGELGNGGTQNVSVPVAASGLSAVRAVAAGDNTSFALDASGAVWAWGLNDMGDLGNGAVGGRALVPTAMAGVSGVLQVAGMRQGGMALEADGSVWTWGYNANGDLGAGTSCGPGPCGTGTPARVSGVSNVVAIAGGYGAVVVEASAPSVTAVAPASGPASGGTTVSISGVNFGGATEVRFGGVAAAAFTVNSASSITATAPAAAAGTVDVTVTTAAGTSAVGAADRFTFTCSGGGYGVTAPSALTEPAITLNGSDQSASVTVPFTVSDMSASGAGWKLQGTSTAFSNGAQALASGATSVVGVQAATAGSPSCSLPANTQGYPVTLPAGAVQPAAVTLYDAAAGTGGGSTVVSMVFSTLVPANVMAGTYAATWSFTVAAGP